MKCALIGEKLGHSYSKIVHKKLGSYDYDLVELPENKLEEFVKKGAYDGFNVTIPYKTAVMRYLDKIDSAAAEIGSVNTVCRVGGKTYGYNTDILGMAYMLKHAGISLTGKNVMILGSGGTGKTAVALARRTDAATVTVVSRKGEVDYKNLYERKETEIIINTTPVGMYPYSDVCLVEPEKFPSLEAVADVIYNPLRTRLLLRAQKLGVKTAGGLRMLVAQAKYSSDLFLNRRSPDDAIERIYRFLSAKVSNVVFVGMPGSGKTSVGKAVARRERKKYADADAAIAEREGRSIPEIFSERGEKYFRNAEKQVLRELGSQSGLVISTGGGAVLDEENYYSLKSNGKIYYIERPLSELATKGRPLSQNPDALEEMEKRRLPLYRAFADVTVKNDGNFFACVDKIREDISHENFDN